MRFCQKKEANCQPISSNRKMKSNEQENTLEWGFLVLTMGWIMIFWTLAFDMAETSNTIKLDRRRQKNRRKKDENG